MRIATLGLVVLVAGCLDRNPVFMQPPATATDTEAATTTTMSPPPTTGAPDDTGPGPSSDPPTATDGGDETSDTDGATTTAPPPDTDSSEGPPPPSDCGNGEVEPGEQCDDGNPDDLDGCTNACVKQECGDGVKTANEMCDDGNQVDEDDCLGTCVLAKCGDGVVHALKEDCEDGNMDPTDACVMCKDAACGDGVVQAGKEDCDDGNLLDGDGCDATCSPSLLIVFVTSQIFPADLEGLFGADAKCNMAAGIGGLPGQYRAWLSTELPANMSAAERIAHAPGYRYVLPDKATVVAADWDALVSGNLQNAIAMTESQGPLPNATTVCGSKSVWTNTTADGGKYQPPGDCNGWNMAGGNAVMGLRDQTGTKWSEGCGPTSCTGQAPLYCVQEP